MRLLTMSVNPADSTPRNTAGLYTRKLWRSQDSALSPPVTYPNRDPDCCVSSAAANGRLA